MAPRKLAVVTQSLATCFSLDFAAPIAVEVASREAKGHLGKQLAAALASIKTGTSLSVAFEAAGLPKILIDAAVLGESTGDFATSFRNAATTPATGSLPTGAQGGPPQPIAAPETRAPISHTA